MKVGLVGVGAMGLNVARALRQRGFEVVVRDLLPEREDEAESFGCTRAHSPAAVAAQVAVLVTLVVDAGQTREVLSGVPREGGPPILMCSTIGPSDTEAMALGRPLVDAPISGGPSRAREGTLSMMIAGAEALVDRCRPVLDAMASKVFRVSERPGDGSRMKVVNNMLAAANLAAGCEALAMASMLGLDVHQAAEVVQASSGGSWIFGDRIPRALANDYEPRAATRVLLKDVGLFVQEARKLGLTAPMAEQAREVFRDAVDRGHGEEDDAAVLKRYAEAWQARRLLRG